MKKILVITGSIRKNGNSSQLANSFIEGAVSAGHEVERIDSALLQISGCVVCNRCFGDGACAMKDDFNLVAPKIENADVIVFATPIYWYTFPAKLKALIDKFYSFCVAKKDVSGKECVLLCCGEAEDAHTGDGLIASYHLIADYLKWKNAGELCVLGVSGVGDIDGSPELKRAKALGASL